MQASSAVEVGRVSRQVKPVTMANVAIAATADGRRNAHSDGPNSLMLPTISQMSSGGFVFQRSG